MCKPRYECWFRLTIIMFKVKNILTTIQNTADSSGDETTLQKPLFFWYIYIRSEFLHVVRILHQIEMKQIQTDLCASSSVLLERFYNIIVHLRLSNLSLKRPGHVHLLDDEKHNVTPTLMYPSIKLLKKQDDTEYFV